jgi:hypothetical protein
MTPDWFFVESMTSFPHNCAYPYISLQPRISLMLQTDASRFRARLPSLQNIYRNANVAVVPLKSAEGIGCSPAI